MPWTENKRLKITIKRETPRKQDMIVEFEVDDAHRSEFRKSLEYALAACQTAGAEFSFKEITDLETGEVVILEIIMTGNQLELAHAFKSNVAGLQANAVWTK